MSVDKYLQRQSALMRLSREQVFNSLSRNMKLNRIVQACVELLDVSRASVWLVSPNEEELYCEALFCSKNGYSNGQRLTAESFPNYFSALRTERVIKAENARTDSRTLEFTRDYFEPNNIYSLLDMPIFYSDKLSGVLCFEHTSPRKWDIETISMGTSVADLISLINITKHWEDSQSQVEQLKVHDALTMLPNRDYFQTQIDLDLAQAPSHVKHYIILLGLDRFSLINNRYGYHQANHELLRFAQTLKRVCHVLDYMPARINGDIFAIWVPGSSYQAALQIINDLKVELGNSDENSVDLNFTASITELPIGDFRGENPFLCAEYALQRAKKESKGSVTQFQPEWVDLINSSNIDDQRLISALKNKEIVPFYQPIVNARTLEVVGVEALARWVTKDGVIRTPDVFLHRLRKLGLMAEFGRSIIEASLAEFSELNAQHKVLKWLSVNISSEQLLSSDFIPHIQRALGETKLTTDHIRLEIVEDLLAEHNPILQSNILNLTKAGLSLSIDDFGTGYSSLSRLKQLPISNLKIDKSFTRGLPDSTEDCCIAASIVGLSLGMQLKVTCEGVETQEQVDWLRDQGCHLLQGFLLAKPMPKEALRMWLRDHKASTEH